MGILIAFLQAVCAAGTSIILRTLSTRMNAFLINGLRTTVGWLILVPVALLTADAGDWALLTPLRLTYLVTSVLVGATFGDYLYVCALRILGVGRAFPITSTYPAFTVLLGFLFLKDQVSTRALVGMAIVLFGVYLVARPRRDVVSMDNTPPLAPRQLWLGVAAAVGAALAWAGGTVIVAFGLTDGINTVMANAVRLPAVVLVSLTAAGRQGQLSSVRRLDRRTIGLVVLAGVLGWAIGGSFYTSAVQLIGPGMTALISSTAPIFAVPMSYFILGERPTRHSLIGTALTIAGIILVI